MFNTTLTEDAILESADLTDLTIPYTEVQAVSFSCQPYQDISLITNITNLQMVTFRLCSFSKIPDEIFQIPTLRNIDFSGNQITTLPESTEWCKLPHLRAVSLGENSIATLQEIFKLVSVTTLIQLNLTGNACLSEDDSFNRIVQKFPNLITLNDSIITSQFRGNIQGYALYSNTSTLPLGKIDDFFFLYVKYMHANPNERTVRRSNSEFFCLSRVVRKYSAAEIIQSQFRGARARAEYKKMRRAALFLEAYLKFWYYKRFKAAMMIKRNFLRHLTRQKTQYIRSVRCVQSSWRRYLARWQFFSILFSHEDKFTMLVLPNSIEKLQQISQVPFTVIDTSYALIQRRVLRKLKFPCSPLIFYNNDGSALIRKFSSPRQISPNSIWCSHNHAKLPEFRKITPFGCNLSRPCPFSSIRYTPYPMLRRSKADDVPRPVYPRFKQIFFSSEEDLIHFLKDMQQAILHQPQALSGINLFPLSVVQRGSALLTIESSIRMFIARKQHFFQMKNQALELRSLTSIKYCLRTAEIHRSIVHISEVHHYSQSLPSSTSFYVTQHFIRDVIKMSPKYKVKFGYNGDRCAVLDPKVEGYLTQILPRDKIVFALDDLSSLIKVGTKIKKANPEMFKIPIPAKWIKKNGISQVIFSSAEEAKHRLTLFAWMSGQYNLIMNEKDVLESCAANMIHRVYRGFTTRHFIVHLVAQQGRSLAEIGYIQKKTKSSFKNKYYVDSFDDSPPHYLNLAPPIDNIDLIRKTYKPWKGQLEEYREYLKNQPKTIDNSNQEEEEKPSSSALALGLVDPKFQFIQRTTIQNLTQSINQSFNDTSFHKNGIFQKSSKPKVTYSAQSSLKYTRLPPTPATPMLSMNKLNTPNNPRKESIQPLQNQSNNSENKADNKPENIEKNSDNTEKKSDNTDKKIEHPHKKTRKHKTKGHRKHSGKESHDSSQSEDTETESDEHQAETDVENEDHSNHAEFAIIEETPADLMNQENEHQTINQNDIDNNADDHKYSPNRCSPKSNGSEESQSRSSPKSNGSDDSQNRRSPKETSKNSSSTNNNKKKVVIHSNSNSTANSERSLSRTASEEMHNLSNIEGTTSYLKSFKPQANEQSNSQQDIVKILSSLTGTNLSLQTFSPSSALLTKGDSQLFTRDELLSMSAQDLFFTKVVTPKTPESRHKRKSISQESSEQAIIESSPLASSTQITVISEQQKVRNAFVKLVRLHQIGSEIQQSAVSDTSFEEKRQLNEKVRAEELQSRNEFDYTKNVHVSEIRARSQIEKSLRNETVENTRLKAQTRLSEKIQKQKEEDQLKKEKYIRGKEFGQTFLQTAAHLASISKHYQKMKKQKQALIQAKQTVLLEKRKSMEASSKLKMLKEEKSEQKRRLARLDRAFIQTKQAENYAKNQKRLEAIHEEKRKEKERQLLLKSQKDPKPYIYPTAVPQVERDEYEEAVSTVMEEIGCNMGELEAMNLVAILENILG